MTARRYTIRRRLVARTMACILLILGATAVAAHLFARHESQEFFSARLASSARVLESLVARQLDTATLAAPLEIPIPREIGLRGGPTRFGHPYEHKIAFQVWNAEGRLLARSASAPVAAFRPFAPGFGEATVDGVLWQVFSLRSGPVWLQVAEKDEVREEMVEQLGASVLWPLAAGSLLLVVAVNLVLTANLKPLRTLADRIAVRQPESLEPVEQGGLPEELAPVVAELNTLLCRVREAFAREQQFIDAAAHEIRTPIAAVQLHVQNAQRAVDDAERTQSLGEASAALSRTTLLAEQLLTFSRLASGTDLVRHDLVSLADVGRDVIALQEPLLARRGQTIGLDVQADAHVAGDAYRLEQLLRNLIDNASRHGDPDGDIDVAVLVRDGVPLLRVANDGPSIPGDEVERIFLPWYRLQGGAVSGAGLGLSIVREIANQHGARIAIGCKDDGQGCVVTVAFAVAGG